MKRATLVGITNYDKSQYYNKLRGCLNDVKIWSNILSNQFGFVTNKKNNIKKEQILKEIEILIRSLDENDIGLFMFSGHGIKLTDIDTNQKIHGLLDGDNKIIYEKEIEDLIIKYLSRKSSLVLIFDSCYSGGIIYEEKTYIGFRFSKPKLIAKGVSEYKEFDDYDKQFLMQSKLGDNSENVTILSACDKNKLSFERLFIDEYYGIFSFYAKEIVKQGYNYKTFIDKINTKINENENEKQKAEIEPQNNFSKKIFL